MAVNIYTNWQKVEEDEWPWKKFSPKEMYCKHTGVLKVDTDFMDRLEAFRLFCGFPFVVTSGYRAPSHPVEAAKSKPGAHTLGCAVDFLYGDNIALHLIINNYTRFGFTGLGIAKTFVHLDSATTESLGSHRPIVWLY